MNLSEHRGEEQVWQKIAICQGPGPEQLGYKAGEQGCWGCGGRQGWQRQLSPGLWKASQAHQRRPPQPLPARKRPEGPQAEADRFWEGGSVSSVEDGLRMRYRKEGSPAHEGEKRKDLHGQHLLLQAGPLASSLLAPH